MGGNITNLTYKMVVALSENYQPKPCSRYMALRLTVKSGTVSKLKDKGRLPVNVIHMNTKRGERVMKRAMNVPEMQQFIQTFEEHVIKDSISWMTLTQPDKMALASLIGAVQQHEENVTLTYWRNKKVFKA